MSAPVPLTVETIRERVELIRAQADDDERAHSAEDQLHQDVLRHFAEAGNSLAAEALKSLDIDFARWCA